MRVTVLGTSYTGLAISVGLATLNHDVTTVATTPGKAKKLQRGMTACLDAELLDRMKLVIREGRLHFTAEPEASLANADIVILAEVLGTDGGINRAALLRTAECLSGAIAQFSIVLVVAQVPVGSCRILQNWLDGAIHTGTISVVAHPVFFKKPDGLAGFLSPGRIVLGYEKESSRRVVDSLFARLLINDPDVVHVSWEAAEMMQTVKTGIAPSIPGGLSGKSDIRINQHANIQFAQQR